ncbi:MAG: hypothetical protein M3275_05570 [Thermoproteota archaeon]|nr:hypothetical protein [Thermoproteota archaeon]
MTLRWVRSSRNWKSEAPNQISHWIDMPLLNLIAGNGQREPTTKRKRNLLRYAPNWYLYVGHYDSKKYRSAMERYKIGRLKSRPNGRSWHKVRSNQVRGQVQSDLKILMAKYNFNQLDIIYERNKKEEDMRLKRGLF